MSILHVRDVSHPDWEAQAADVESILGELGLSGEAGTRILEVWNKIDALDPTSARRDARSPRAARRASTGRRSSRR